MDASDKEHLTKAIEQLQLFLLTGLIAQLKDYHSSSSFITTTSRVLSLAMDELSQLSAGVKEKISEIKWEYVDQMKNPEEIRRQFLMNPVKMYHIIREDLPGTLLSLKNALNSEN